MDKDILLQKLKEKKYTHEQLIGWVTAMPTSTAKRKPTEYRVGDVLMHNVFAHPYILLKKRKEDWLCGLFTTEESFPDILEPCQSRFFKDSHFVKSIFTAVEPQGMFMNTYGNDKHLREVLIKLKNILK
jgi:hypothetical protein